VEVVVEGVGTAPQLRQQNKGGTWEGRLTTTESRGVLLSPQRFSLPEAGLQSVSLDGGGSAFQLTVTPMQGVPLGNPVVSADGKNLILSFPSASQVVGQTSRPNLMQPGAIPQPSYAPPLQPRAVAPPLGDMAVGSMLLRNPGFVNAQGPNVTLTLRKAPARDALMAIAQLGGYGFVYIGEDLEKTSQTNIAGDKSASAAAEFKVSDERGLVTLLFKNETYSRALNSILLAAGLQGKLDGKTLLAGKNVLDKSFGSQISKVFRLNQATAASAADYLASLGAAISKISLTTATTQATGTAGTAVSSAGPAPTSVVQAISSVETYGAATGPLKGLLGTTDSRLQTLTLIGDPLQVAVAENYLKQIDLRQRQVALSVKVLDVTLADDKTVQNSFAFRYGNNFIVNDNGQLLGAFNSNLPPNQAQFDAASNGTSTTVYPPVNPGMTYEQNQFYDYVKAQIESASTKVLASPTLILSENPEDITGGAEVSSGASTSGLATATIGRPRANESFVTVGTQEITSFTVVTGVQGSPNTCQPQFETSGLTFGARISKIDDNGFVTFTLSPSISAVSGNPVEIPGCGPIKILRTRRLDTGSVRVRDGQTLVLTGVISDEDTQVVSKWPIVGDIPLVGQFFRSGTGFRRKNELVILVSPKIIDDTEGGAYGYGYRPGTSEVKRMLSGSM